MNVSDAAALEFEIPKGISSSSIGSVMIGAQLHKISPITDLPRITNTAGNETQSRSMYIQLTSRV
jgi:hypothetical protein